MSAESERAISEECDAVKEMLLSKNRAYGNSALEPIRVMSRASSREQLLVRIDDKLSRIQRGHEHGDDDSVLDLIGYLILLRVAAKKSQDVREYDGTWEVLGVHWDGCGNLDTPEHRNCAAGEPPLRDPSAEASLILTDLIAELREEHHYLIADLQNGKECYCSGQECGVDAVLDRAEARLRELDTSTREPNERIN